jgi:prepilin-type N-terminal cleavage/methylation domain-containing protein
MKRQSGPDGFTLVEVLIVIAIIGVLMGMTIAGVNAARLAIQRRAVALEVTTIAQAIEAYKQKYQEYPPDGSNINAFNAHFRQIFPNMVASEFDALASGALASHSAPAKAASTPAAGGYMDPAEALVFCLGGFSKDPVHPFTGKGGPLLAVGTTGYQYNTDRNEGIFQFPQEQLTIEVSSGVTISNDEDLYGTGNRDALPVYRPRGRTMPLVYFSSSSYANSNYTGTNLNGSGIKPYKSENINTGVTYSAATKNRHFRFMNDKTYQLLSAGLDDDFGALPSADQYFTFPNGHLIDISSATALQNPLSTDYKTSAGGISGHFDNVTSFSDGSLGDSLP